MSPRFGLGAAILLRPERRLTMSFWPDSTLGQPSRCTRLAGRRAGQHRLRRPTTGEGGVEKTFVNLPGFHYFPREMHPLVRGQRVFVRQ
jgi:hypothetical protein